MTTLVPLRYDPSQEAVADDETETIQKLQSALQEIGDTTFRNSGHGYRTVHAKSHALLVGEFEVLPLDRPELAQGLFGKPGVHPAVIRISTNPGDMLDDAISVPRGLASEGAGRGRRAPAAGRRAHAGLRDGQRPGLPRADSEGLRQEPRPAGQDDGPRAGPEEGVLRRRPRRGARHRGRGRRERDAEGARRPAADEPAGRELFQPDAVPLRRLRGEVLPAARELEHAWR